MTAANASTVTAKVKCGQTITKSIRLANNLVGCTGTGLVIGADHVTIDLAGHSITGINTRGSEGIADDGHAGARIQNGRVEGFFLNGVGLRNAPRSSVTGLTIRKIGAGGMEPDASAGVLVKSSPHARVASNAISNDVSAFQSDGVDVLSSAGSSVTGNHVLKNAWDGMFVLQSPATRIIGNTFNGNQNQGVELNAGSDHSVLSRNHAADNVSNGLVVGAVSGVLLDRNTVSGNGDNGIFLFDLHDSRLTNNRAGGGNGAGIDLEGGQNGSADNTVVNNDSSGNLFAGIVIDNADRNQLTGNVSNGNLGAPGEGGGIVLISANGNVLRSNRVIGNHDVGIGVFEDEPGDSTGNTLARNTAIHNAGHGIDAVAGTIDGGGNLAHNNTPLPNCLGVVCR